MKVWLRQASGLTLEFLFPPQGHLFGGGHKQHIAFQAVCEIAGPQHEFERLFPGHAVKLQGDIARNSLAGHPIEVLLIRKNLQGEADGNVLKRETGDFHRRRAVLLRPRDVGRQICQQ